MSPELERQPTGYDLLAATDPDDPAWLDAMKLAIHDGSARQMASTIEDVRRRRAELKRNQ